MKRLAVFAAVIFTLILLGSGPAFAQDTMRTSPMPHQRMQMMHRTAMHRFDMLKKLNLTDQQKQKIADLRIDFQKKMVDLKAGLQKSKLDLKELRIKGNLNRNDVIASVEKINKNRDDIALAVANHLMDVYEVLTPEQQKIWQKNAPMMMNEGMHRGYGMMQHKWMTR